MPATNGSDFRRFARAMRTASRDIGKELRRAEMEAAKVVAVRAREIAAEKSPKVAATIKPFARADMIGVQAGRVDDPLARLLEIGNMSSGASLLHAGEGGTFKHPVWATGDRSTWHWNNEHPRRFTRTWPCGI